MSRKTILDFETLATTRLLAERISLSHYHEIHRLYSDPRVMETLATDGKPYSQGASMEHLQECVDHWEQHGFGYWVFYKKSDEKFIGQGGLKAYQIEGKEIIGLAYAVLSDYWNQGFATEIAEAGLDTGFHELGFPEIGSWTLPINFASQRVMEKLGFHYQRNFKFAGLLHKYYQLTREEWKKAKAT